MLDLADPLWRLGYSRDPLGFKPYALYGWTNRFDDAHREYRTIYLAEERRTCLCELLQDLRPNAKAIRDFKKVFPGEEIAVGVPLDWIDKEVFVATHVELDEDAFDLRDGSMRTEFERNHADIMVDHDLDHLNLSELTSRRREFTQALSRAVYDDGYSGIVFPSNAGPGACLSASSRSAEV